MNYIFWSINNKTGGYPNREVAESNRYGLCHKLWALMLKWKADEDLESNLEHSWNTWI